MGETQSKVKGRRETHILSIAKSVCYTYIQKEGGPQAESPTTERPPLRRQVGLELRPVLLALRLSDLPSESVHKLGVSFGASLNRSYSMRSYFQQTNV